MKEERILNSSDINSKISSLAEEVYADIQDMTQLAIVGVQTGGVEIARRLKNRLEKLSGVDIKSGILDITFYRDDLATRGMLPVIRETKIEFDITKKIILLVDDVLFTGRTTKAALETITAFGRPHAIKLFVLIDRGNRELPIQPDYCGFTIETSISDKIQLLLSDTNIDDDKALLIKE